MNTGKIVIFQSAKLGNLSMIVREIQWAGQLFDESIEPGRIYGSSGGSLCALALALSLSARMDPSRWGQFNHALKDMARFLSTARSAHIRQLNLNPAFGIFNLNPLRKWLNNYLTQHGASSDLLFSDLPAPLYICAMDKDGILTLFGKENPALTMSYQFAQIQPPQNVAIVDALIASVSTMLSTEPALVNQEYYRDNRPAMVDIGAIVCDLEKCDPDDILRSKPHAEIRRWKLNFITSSFIMHSQHERNQCLLASYDLDLKRRHKHLRTHFHTPDDLPQNHLPSVTHVQLPYVGSTEAATNMRDSVAHKEELMEKFSQLLNGQLDDVDFSQPANIIYGAGGFSGILAGLVTTRAVDKGFEQNPEGIRNIYGVSAGVINGFFHAVQIAAKRHPNLYTESANRALLDLEDFIANLSTERILRINYNPFRLWQGIANLEPLEKYLEERLAAYTNINNPETVAFDDIKLPLTVAVSRGDGLTDFLGMSQTGRKMRFAGKTIEIKRTPVVKAIIAGWSMNTYIQPTKLHGEEYRDGGGTFYDIGLFAACLDPDLINLINIHLDEPEGHSYHIPPRPNLLRILFDTHNYTFPEERRRMFCLTNLLYDHYALRTKIKRHAIHHQEDAVVGDFRQCWEIIDNAKTLTVDK